MTLDKCCANTTQLERTQLHSALEQVGGLEVIYRQRQVPGYDKSAEDQPSLIASLA